MIGLAFFSIFPRCICCCNNCCGFGGCGGDDCGGGGINFVCRSGECKGAAGGGGGAGGDDCGCSGGGGGGAVGGGPPPVAPCILDIISGPHGIISFLGDTSKPIPLDCPTGGGGGGRGAAGGGGGGAGCDLFLGTPNPKPLKDISDCCEYSCGIALPTDPNNDPPKVCCCTPNPAGENPNDEAPGGEGFSIDEPNPNPLDCSNGGAPYPDPNNDPPIAACCGTPNPADDPNTGTGGADDCTMGNEEPNPNPFDCSDGSAPNPDPNIGPPIACDAIIGRAPNPAVDDPNTGSAGADCCPVCDDGPNRKPLDCCGGGTSNPDPNNDCSDISCVGCGDSLPNPVFVRSDKELSDAP